jgi:Cu(I)/Ag(I) efflux system membrane protein CusA/SilA
VLLPIVFFIIFMLLYITFHSAAEAHRHALVVFAMTARILQWMLGYNFSVACGSATSRCTASRANGVSHGRLPARSAEIDGSPRARASRAADVLQATIDGSVLRLRPKLMTVSGRDGEPGADSVSTGVGADVMKPIAAPIIGGMITSTIHVLIQYPIIFLHAEVRALRRALGPSGRDRHLAHDRLRADFRAHG